MLSLWPLETWTDTHQPRQTARDAGVLLERAKAVEKPERRPGFIAATSEVIQ